MADYAIIALGGKQYRVRAGDRLLVDRLKVDEGASFEPSVLLGADGGTVTAKVVAHVLGDKIRIGKYRPKTGYRRHAGHRSRLTQIEIESIGGAPKRRSRTKKQEDGEAE